ncbi:MAG: aminotransferase class I/II-fold pyridoxal phosphate-dependent enzyme [Coriobacteriales bacterium]|jgi:O-acetylhomoserine (thiol)-lyase|nr:aminotransferase class I/II-fold pyridoxal phosphate-dependent enzyme [Coriobacteriales bacterium]
MSERDGFLDPVTSAGVFDFDTLKVHAGYDPADHHGATSVPVYETAAFGLGSPERAQRLFTFQECHPTYSRTANPTVGVLESRLAALHGVPGAVAVASGMAAVSYALLNAVGASGRVLSIYQLYGGTLDAFASLFPQFAVDFDAVEDPTDLTEFARRLTPETKCIFIESITNPLATVLDIEGIAAIAHEHGIPLIVDNTIATPWLLNPFEFGADVVVYSATKALAGHGNALAGVILESGDFDYANGRFPHFTERLWAFRNAEDEPRSILEVSPRTPFVGRVRNVLLNYLGATLGAFDAWLVLLGIDTLSERVHKQCESTKRLIEYLRTEPLVDRILHPSCGSADADLVKKYLPRGEGSVLSFSFKGSRQQQQRFLESLRVFIYQANIGDARSLIIDPALTTHNELTPAQREKLGLGLSTIRISVGLENPCDLIADLRQAFAAVR